MVKFSNLCATSLLLIKIFGIASFSPVLQHKATVSSEDRRLFFMVSGDNQETNGVIENNEAIENEQHNLRFSGIGRLYDNPSDAISIDSHLDIVEKLSVATVAIVGIGGVGSWAAEALCRSGIGNIILMDLDDICISNTNRQLHAMSSTIGKLKIEETKKRLEDINPKANITLIHDFVTSENAFDLLNTLLPEVDVILDAIDGQVEKTALIAASCVKGVPIVTCGGAAGRIDPTKIVVDDLTKSADCRLLFSCKKVLRDHYRLFTKGPSTGNLKKYRPRKWNIAAVFSTEIQKNIEQDKDTSSLRRCDGALGTACFVTGTFGFVAASHVVSMIVNDKLVKPRVLKSAVAALLSQHESQRDNNTSTLVEI